MPSLSFNSFASISASAPNTAPTSPAMSRSNSVSSITSHQSLPVHTSATRPAAGPRSTSVTSTQSHPAPSTNASGHGLKHFFSAEGRAERKEKKRKEEERISKVLLTSKHAAMVKTRMLLEQQNRKNGKGRTAGVTGTTSSAHLTAAQQEARLPHSGPPALHSVHSRDQDRDMPSLTRIVSCDERDEEEERAKQHRDDWLSKKADVTAMHRLREGSESSEEGVIEVLHGRVIENIEEGMGRVQLESEVCQTRMKKSRKGFGAYSRNEAGVWTR